MPIQEKIPVIAVVGPTASGKTGLGVRLAKRFAGEVVSADSMQVYRGMPIGTAQPTQEEMEGIPHHLMGFLDPQEQFSVARWCQLAEQCIRDIRERGNLPILVGGTGLYISSLLDNIRFVDSPADPELRRRLNRRAQEEGGQALLDELAQYDPETAATLHPNNVGRIVRAMEMYRLTGITMSEQRLRSREQPSPYHPVIIGICYKDRQKLYDRINTRVDQMMEQGLLEEAKAAMKIEEGCGLQAIGHKELFPYIKGKISLEEAVEHLKQSTRRYAKRQLTWFRRDERVHWLEADRLGNTDVLCKKAYELVEKGLGL
ncbi:tRNA (adenosine(37)-N6)-dimethylallyltransferase MiaA [[Clostridium] leptum]|nr:tRNA (adenosine(37)-N6)-dimethylallyltransferase MiaA [[Clostridium] leptum]